MYCKYCGNFSAEYVSFDHPDKVVFHYTCTECGATWVTERKKR